MDILFLGLIYRPLEETKLIQQSKSGLGIASNLLQINMINGLKLTNSGEVQVLTTLPVGNYPHKNKKIYYRGKKYVTDTDVNVTEIPTVNMPWIKDHMRFKLLKEEIRQWENNLKNDENKIIILYDLNIAMLRAVKWAKENYGDIKIFICIPDLIGKHRNKNISSKIESFFVNFRQKNIYDYLECVDGYILITEQMVEFLPKKPFVVVNGMIKAELDVVDFSINTRSEKLIIMYSGLLSKQYEIDLLVDHIISSEQNVELWLCGYGELSEYIKTVDSPKVKYFGILPKQKTRELENQADILINPRPNTGEYTKYSFPSKNLEYLLSAKPVICYKLDGIPAVFDEFFDYINSFSDLDKVLYKYLHMTLKERESICRRNYMFVTKNFNYINQSRRIMNFIKEASK